MAKSFEIAGSETRVVVEPDGTLHVVESITFDFDGSFTGAYRDIPLKWGETFQLVAVTDETGDYRPGGCTTLGCSSPPGLYGTELTPGLARIVWHHDTTDRTRTFQLTYRLTGVALVYDDVVDLNLQVWGDQWAVGNHRLTASVGLPSGASPGEVLVFGHPYGVNGETSLGEDELSPSLEASGISSYQAVQMRVLFPPELLTSTAGAQVVGGRGLEAILAEEESLKEDANDVRDAARAGLTVAGLSALGLTLGLGGLVYLAFGREPSVDYDQEYEHAPPSSLRPAEVGALLSQGGVDEKQFTATLFDLINRGAIAAEPSQVVRSTWGGLKHEEISDLVLTLTDKETSLNNYERTVMDVMRRALELGSLPLHELYDAIREDRAANAESYQNFRREVLDEIEASDLIDTSGKAMSWFIRIGAVLMVILGGFIVSRTASEGAAGEVFFGLVVVGLIVGVIGLFVLMSFRRVKVKRTPAGALEAARWSAFRDYLKDFSQLEQAPAISLALWNDYLIYGITFGVAAQVLEQARLHAPEALAETSAIYWYGHHGYGGGHTQNAFVGIESALAGAFTPPSSSGSGGGFSGGFSGGGGSGGGGGGAW